MEFLNSWKVEKPTILKCLFLAFKNMVFERSIMRFLRLFIMFDLPVETSRERREYRKFVKFLLNEGYVRSQYSIYCKLILNKGTLNHQLSKLKQNLPSNGIVQSLIVTEKQFSDMTYLVGEPVTKYDVNTTERMLEL